MLLVFCVGISLIQVHGAKKMNEGVAKEKRELESSPYEFNVPQKRYNYQVVNLPNDDYYHGVHEQLSSSNYNQNTAGMNQKPSYYSGQFGEFPVKNQNFGYSGFPQEAAPSFGQFDSLNKFSAAPFSGELLKNLKIFTILTIAILISFRKLQLRKFQRKLSNTKLWRLAIIFQFTTITGIFRIFPTQKLSIILFISTSYANPASNFFSKTNN